MGTNLNGSKKARIESTSSSQLDHTKFEESTQGKNSISYEDNLSEPNTRYMQPYRYQSETNINHQCKQELRTMNENVGLTFTGVDQGTDLGRLEHIWVQYPGAEFAVLVGGSTGLTPGNPRFPNPIWIEAITDIGNKLGRCAAMHLCGPYAKHANGGRITKLREITRGFARIQVNSQDEEYRMAQIAAMATSLEGNPQIIVQTRMNPPQAPEDQKIAALFDRSGGNGEDWIDTWRRPAVDDGRVGFAGGLGPKNIEKALSIVGEWGITTWLDMESGVRTDDRFDLDKVEAVCAATWGKGNPENL